MNAKDIFEVLLPSKLEQNPSLFKSHKFDGSSVRLQMDGALGGDWTLVFGADGSASIQKNRSGSCSCHIQMSDDSFAKLVAGKLNVPMALITRKIKVSGDKTLAMKVGEALQRIL